MPTPPPNPRRALEPRWLFWGLVLLALAVLITGIAGDFLFGHDGWCAARRAVAARNYLQYGPAASHFGPVENFTPVTPDRFNIYWHHPPGMHLLVALSTWLLGLGEWQVRLVPILISLASFLTLSRLTLDWWTGPGRPAALALFATLPMLGVYGPLVGQDTLTLLFMLLATLTWVRWHQTHRPRYLALSFALAFAAAWSDWPWFLFAFGLAIVELARLAGRRRLDLRWLVTFSVAVLLGFAAVLYHLILIQGESDPLVGFSKLFDYRAGSPKESLTRLLATRGHRWMELFTPTLLAAGLAWLPLAALDIFRGRATSKHALALLSLVVGSAWVVLFKQGARIHEYWPIYASIYFVIAGADLVERLAAALDRHSGRLRHAGAAVATVLVVLQVIAGLAGVVGRHQQLDRDHPHRSDDYRLRNGLVTRWLAEHSDPADRIAVQRGFTTAKFQVGYYLPRKVRSFRVGDTTTRLPVSTRDQWAVVDLQAVPQVAQSGLIKATLQRHPVVVLEDFLIVDLRRRVEQPEVTWLDRRDQPAPWWHTWLVSMVYAPYELVDDPLLAAEFLLHAGFREQALKTYATVRDMPSDLAHRLADHNLALAAGLKPPAPESWLPELIPPRPEVEPPPSFGGAVTLLAARVDYDWRLAVEFDLVFRCDRVLGEDWRPFVHRVTHLADDPEGRPKIIRQSATVMPDPALWRPGQLLRFRGHIGLNREHTGAELRFGFWRAGSKRHREGFLRPGRSNHLSLSPLRPVPGPEPEGALPWYLRWLDLWWLENLGGAKDLGAGVPGGLAALARAGALGGGGVR